MVRLKKSKKLRVWQTSTIILGLLLIVSLFTNGSSNGSSITGQAVATKAVNYINQYLLSGQGVATVKSVDESGNLYNIKLDISGQEFDSYATKDGKLLFPSVINLDETPQTPSTTPSATTPADVPKSDKPVVELFVMSYCPYGTQMEKGILPVVNELGDKIDFKIKFVYYSMHPTQGEVEEQLNQYCIQRDYNDKYLSYLGKFLEAGDSEAAFSEVGLTKADISQCVEETDKEFNVTQNLENKSSWVSGRYPKFTIYNEDNLKYGVEGSPTLVINGVQAQSGRDAQSLMSTICAAFNNEPSECSTDMTSFGSPSPGFGFDTQGGSASAAGCGV